jgi:hypothetical protein
MVTMQKSFWKNPSFILAIYILAAGIACFTKIAIDLKPHDAGYISKINNFIIFKNSFFHLINHLSLYGAYPVEHYDLYKYSPTFALLFAPFAILPTYVGAILWAVFNATLLYYAIAKLPIADNKRVFVWWFMLIELITSIQNSQVNPLIAALFIFTFIAFENKQIWLAALIIVLSAYIKVYGVLGASLFLLYDEKLKFIGYGILWSVVLFFAPLCILSIDELFNQYKGWQETIANDHQSRAVDVSIMRFIMSIGKIPFNDQLRLSIQLSGVGLFCLKYLRVSFYSAFRFRFLFLASIMIWCIVFNHLAESATFIIAIAGVALWYTTEHQNKLSFGLLIAVFILSSLSPTDIFPRSLRELYIVPYALKALPCFCVWVLIEYKLLSGRFAETNAP